MEAEPGLERQLLQHPWHVQLGECTEPDICCQCLPSGLWVTRGEILQGPEGSGDVCSDVNTGRAMPSGQMMVAGTFL